MRPGLDVKVAARLRCPVGPNKVKVKVNELPLAVLGLIAGDVCSLRKNKFPFTGEVVE